MTPEERWQELKLWIRDEFDTELAINRMPKLGRTQTDARSLITLASVLEKIRQLEDD